MAKTQSTTIRLHRNDNVVVARDDIAEGGKVTGEGVDANTMVPAGHK
nr:hypothetical protein [Alphaproteobacteria bacterium]